MRVMQLARGGLTVLGTQGSQTEGFSFERLEPACEDGRLSFEVNDKDLGIAYTEVPLPLSPICHVPEAATAWDMWERRLSELLSAITINAVKTKTSCPGDTYMEPAKSRVKAPKQKYSR